MSKQEIGVIVGKNIRRVRKEKDIGLNEMAKKLGYRTTDGYYRVEKGINELKVAMLVDIATVLGVPLSELVTGIPELESISTEPTTEEAFIKHYLSESESEMLSLFRRASEKRRARIIAYLRDQVQLSILEEMQEVDE